MLKTLIALKRSKDSTLSLSCPNFYVRIFTDLHKIQKRYIIKLQIC